MVTLADRLCPVKSRKCRLWVAVIGLVVFILLIIGIVAIALTRSSKASGAGSPQVAEIEPVPATSPQPTASETLSGDHPVFPSPQPRPTEPKPPGPQPSPAPSPAPTEVDLTGVTYQPGNLTTREVGLLLSEGLTARIIAQFGQKVTFDAGGQSEASFHARPDYGAAFAYPDDHADYPGGWLYLSNSEVEEEGKGGVGAVSFDREGRVVKYEMILTGTTMNCAGGRTPWNTFISCEEVGAVGEVYQVDPYGIRPAQVATGFAKGRLESFAYDDRDRDQPRFFVTEDERKGALRRFTPDTVDWDSPWDILHGEGKLDYLVLEPESENSTKGTYRWTSDFTEASLNAELYYPNSEGLDRDKNILFITCKKVKRLFLVNLDNGTYESFSTEHGAFDGTPDQVKRILADDDREILYFVEDQGARAGIHGRNRQNQYFTILEDLDYSLESTGLAFSPDGQFMYFTMQDDGVLFEVKRLDGLPFHGVSLDVRYHNRPDELS